MKKIYKLLILFGLLSGILFVSLIFFIDKENQKTKNDTLLEVNIKSEIIPVEQEIILSDEITISMQEDKEVVLQEDKEIIFYSKSLQPTFVVEKGEKISDLKFYFDDPKENLLNSKFSTIGKEYKGKKLEIKFPYTLSSKKHQVILKYNLDNQEIIRRYCFLLILFDDFSTTLNKSKLWGMTKEASKLYNNWEIKDGQLIANSYKAPAGAVSSLFFVRRFQGDFFVEFDLIPKSDNISFNAYLLERELNFVFGNGNNKDVTILNKGAKGKFIFEPFKTYRIKLIREQNIYKVFIVSNKDFNSTLFNFSDNDLVLIYEDKERSKFPYDYFGFTIWPKSGGVKIDNFYTANEDIDNYINSYE